MNTGRKIKIGIVGYGNLGRGVESGIRQNPDMELVAFFTRRDPSSLSTKSPHIPVVVYNDMKAYIGKIDVMVLCGGSATDLALQTPEIVKMFNTVDSFDTHSRIPEFFKVVDEAARTSGHTGIISVGWDPGMFSIARVYSNCILPEGKDYTFWGPGVSQGHSDAVRRISGVRNAIQYTLPVDSAIAAVRNGENPGLTTRQKHTRVCYVVPEEGADQKVIEEKIKSMPAYFDEYDTTVHFITAAEFEKSHGRMNHGGFVFRSGVTGENGINKHIIEYSLRLDSNPEFTSSALLAYARAAFRLSGKSDFGAKTVFDVAPALLSPVSNEELRKRFL